MKFIISDGGICPDDEKFAALRNFQQPGNDVKELWSFLDLVAQFGAFAPDSACLTSHLRHLLQKETPWLWLPEQNLDFENTKKALTSPTMLQPFDPNVKTVVLTDASCLHGIGFALAQVYKDKLALILCGSASLSPTQSRYSTVELECLAIVHAIQKCHYYLAGIARFEVWTDHRPLVGAFEKHLHLLQNQRLMKMREKITSYNFLVIWTPGKSHHIADALSHAPVFGPCDQSFEPEHLERCLHILDASLT